jgi:RNA polymerase sigma-70 factor (ECF subfamily)
MERLPDNYYVEKIRNGETNNFATLLERYSKQVFSLIVRVVGRREEAEELTQDVFVKVFRSIDSFRGESSFSTWLYRIAYNMAISATRKTTKEFVAIDENVMNNYSDEQDDDSDDESDASLKVEYLNRALEQLPVDERAMILLFYKEDKLMSEIAEITGLTVTNIKTKIFRIRRKLLVIMKEMEEKKNE